MEVLVHNFTVISQKQIHAKVTKIALTVFDRLASDMHIGVVYSFNPPMATNAALIDGLTRTLVHFPTLAGHLGEDEDGRPSVILGDHTEGGVLVVEAMAASNLEDHLPLTPSRNLKNLYPPLEDAVHLLQVQINRFACGGLILGITAHHRIADGQSMSYFFTTWGKSVRGLQLDQLPVYDHDWLLHREPPICKFRHWIDEFVPLAELPTVLPKAPPEPRNLDNVLVHYSVKFISELKGHAPVNAKFSRFEVLMGHLWKKITVARGLYPGHLWKKITVARGLYPEDVTQVRIAINGRPRLSSPIVPTKYFGNLVLNAFPRAKVRCLEEFTVNDSAQLVKDSVRQIGEAYFQSFIDFGAINQGKELVPVSDREGGVLSPNLEVHSWLGFDFHKMDFGGGGLCAFLPSWVPVEGVVILMPSLHEDDKGGIDVVVTLLEEHAKVFRLISHSLG
ncbi:tryptamine hydroxycinnamoyltransferase 1-like [Aristolochia californica]|uniref:tryptamine hydroxycinnamoyltransferase 1-like n=1 Tax=Aristolochia californica TaxID=171875 RepID=UPI0035E3503C